ncbi:UDP-MurNac-pentapeptide presynthetase MurF [Helicobacter enhydrae]|uniref:UDP-MurNac-pentapeptide presynthetase MurF n=1 Tax=Helicobacter enhydrae TaxID=222136 RepID=A0A1B1U785_9HELI|nr:UDP-N-acetylmuramoyl-tripeptide--D-alanyl-D-alanine ligase [Helicobacter enhydrae]ANV98600.1 UDP-MurNac-pentapeptide presynthetase MurF [Helicobacter enhydrae]
MEYVELFKVLFLFALGYYVMTNLQWYNYSFLRVVTKHHKQRWHLLYFVLPVLCYCLSILGEQDILVVLLGVLYVIALFLWGRALDRRLKWTGRVWRFFGIYAVLIGVVWMLKYCGFQWGYLEFWSLPLALVVSNVLEYLMMVQYKKKALQKIDLMQQLKIIAITASFGKTSIKNFLHQILSHKFAVYATPRSVNTLNGIIADINQHLDMQTRIYIVEAGAREKGDIAQISQFLNPQYVIIGKIGEQHLEYFKSLDNIVSTKFEILQSKRLRSALVAKDNPLPQEYVPKEILKFVPKEMRNIEATLDHTRFEMQIKNEWHEFQTSVLGSFNAYNIALAIVMANEMGMGIDEIKKCVANLKPVEHRLHKSIVNGRVILDDSFNGNFEGMQEAIRIASEYQGRRVIVTPGIVEGVEEMNVALAQEMDQVFDLVVITGELNAKILSSHISRAKKIILKDKSTMQDTLKLCLKDGDLILFANDAPNYI